jgi:large subunit ribosomal protein L1
MMAKLGKRLTKAYEGIDRLALHSLTQAVQIVKTRATAKFDETIEVAMNLGVDPRKAEQAIRGVVQLPHGTGKTLRVCVFARGPKADEAKAAGADVIGAEELVEEIIKGKMDFDRCIATPDMMVLVGRLGKALGPRGLMPNPKLGTVTMDVASAVKAAKAGQVEFRTDRSGILQAGVGKASFSEKKLEENIRALFDVILKARPQGLKGSYVSRVSLSSTMGVGVKIDVNDVRGA